MMIRTLNAEVSDTTGVEQRCERRLKKNSFAILPPASENNVLLQSLESSKFTDCPASKG
jgi:hypothetical protein